MYKIASKLQQKARDRLSPNQVIGKAVGVLPEVQSPEDKIKNLHAALKMLDQKILAATSREQRRDLGQQKIIFQNELSELNKIAKQRRIAESDKRAVVYERSFMMQAKRMLPPALYQKIVAAAEEAIKPKPKTSQQKTQCIDTSH